MPAAPATKLADGHSGRIWVHDDAVVGGGLRCEMQDGGEVEVITLEVLLILYHVPPSAQRQQD
jgi:hypothetical protein